MCEKIVVFDIFHLNQCTKSLNLDNCQSLTRIPQLTDNVVYEMTSDFHMDVKSVEASFVICLEGNIRLCNEDTHKASESYLCLVFFYYMYGSLPRLVWLRICRTVLCR